MLGGGNAMKKKQDIINELDQAIDAMDIDGIDIGLEALTAIETHQIQVENTTLFAARIKKMNKENVKMIKPRNYIKVAVIAAAIMTMGLTVYAANALNIFSFVQGNRFVTMRTNESITDDKGNQMQVQVNPDAPKHDESSIDVPKSQKEYSFKTAAQAENELDMKLVLPSVAVQMRLESATGHIIKHENLEYRFACLQYSDTQERKIDIANTKVINNSDIPSVFEQQFGGDSLGTYKNKFDTDFALFPDTNKTVYIVAIGEYEYSISFTGYSEKEQKEIVDTINLSEYK